MSNRDPWLDKVACLSCGALKRKWSPILDNDVQVSWRCSCGIEMHMGTCQVIREESEEEPKRSRAERILYLLRLGHFDPSVLAAMSDAELRTIEQSLR